MMKCKMPIAIDPLGVRNPHGSELSALAIFGAVSTIRRPTIAIFADSGVIPREFYR